MSQTAFVLLVEDEENDVFFLKHAFHEAEITQPLAIVPDGRQAIAYLRAPFSTATNIAPYPSTVALLLLDLKLPVIDGFEVLHWIQQQPRLRGTFPIVVLTSSEDPDEKQQALKLGVQEFLIKPRSVLDLITLARRLKQCWLEPPAHLSNRGKKVVSGGT